MGVQHSGQTFGSIYFILAIYFPCEKVNVVTIHIVINSEKYCIIKFLKKILKNPYPINKIVQGWETNLFLFLLQSRKRNGERKCSHSL